MGKLENDLTAERKRGIIRMDTGFCGKFSFNAEIGVITVRI